MWLTDYRLKKTIFAYLWVIAVDGRLWPGLTSLHPLVREMRKPGRLPLSPWERSARIAASLRSRRKLGCVRGG
jgi:hypothetical protein